MEQYHISPYTQINPMYNAINVSESTCPTNKMGRHSISDNQGLLQKTSNERARREYFDYAMIENLQVFTGEFFAISDRLATPCNCEGMEKKMEEMKVTMHQKLNVLQGQIKLALESLEEQKEMLQQLLKSRDEILQEESLPLHTKFPLKTEEKLIKLNEEITPENRKLYIKAIGSLLHPEGIRKNLKNIISTDITNAYNIEGVQGKKSFRTLENFYALLLDSIPVTSTSGTAEVQLRKAIQLQKKRYLKKISIAKHAFEDDDNYDSDLGEKLVLRKRLRQHDPLDIVYRPKEKEKEITLYEKFPLVTERQLVELNGAITPGNRGLYIKAMKALLYPEGVRKNLKNIIGSDVTQAYNVEGVHNKKSFKSLSNFYRALIDSITVTSESGTAEVQLRNAIQLQKKRFFKKVSVMKRKNGDA